MKLGQKRKRSAIASNSNPQHLSNGAKKIKVHSHTSTNLGNETQAVKSCLNEIEDSKDYLFQNGSASAEHISNSFIQEIIQKYEVAMEFYRVALSKFDGISDELTTLPETLQTQTVAMEFSGESLIKFQSVTDDLKTLIEENRNSNSNIDVIDLESDEEDSKASIFENVPEVSRENSEEQLASTSTSAPALAPAPAPTLNPNLSPHSMTWLSVSVKNEILGIEPNLATAQGENLSPPKVSGINEDREVIERECNLSPDHNYYKDDNRRKGRQNKNKENHKKKEQKANKSPQKEKKKEQNANKSPQKEKKKEQKAIKSPQKEKKKVINKKKVPEKPKWNISNKTSKEKVIKGKRKDNFRKEICENKSSAVNETEHENDEDETLEHLYLSGDDSEELDNVDLTTRKVIHKSREQKKDSNSILQKKYSLSPCKVEIKFREQTNCVTPPKKISLPSDEVKKIPNTKLIAKVVPSTSKSKDPIANPVIISTDLETSNQTDERMKKKDDLTSLTLEFNFNAVYTLATFISDEEIKMFCLKYEKVLEERDNDFSTFPCPLCLDEPMKVRDDVKDHLQKVHYFSVNEYLLLATNIRKQFNFSRRYEICKFCKKRTTRPFAHNIKFHESSAYDGLGKEHERLLKDYLHKLTFHRMCFGKQDWYEPIFEKLYKILQFLYSSSNVALTNVFRSNEDCSSILNIIKMYFKENPHNYKPSTLVNYVYKLRELVSFIHERDKSANPHLHEFLTVKLKELAMELRTSK